MDWEQLMHQREQIAGAYGFKLWERYSEKEVAAILAKRPADKDVDTSTLKRNRAKKLIPFGQDAGGGIYYMGMMVADLIAFGKDAVLLHPKPDFAKLMKTEAEVRGVNLISEALRKKNE